MKTLPRNLPQPRFDSLTLFMMLAMSALAVIGCNKGTFSKAKAQTSNLACEADVGIVNGEPDAGVSVNVTVKNVGQSGFINIKPELSTSEGEWSRSQDIHFDAGESQTLTYFFDEPTVNARNIQCRIAVSP